MSSSKSLTFKPVVELRPHNALTYARAKKVLQEQHQVAIVQATGTGKSFLMMRLIEELFQGKRVLYIVPYLRIGENFQAYKEFGQLNIQFTVRTYDAFGAKNPPVTDDYDVVLIDEFHHIGSVVYGRALVQFKDQMIADGKYVIAVSATPVRALDNYRDMGDEAFSGCVVAGIQAEEAIELGIIQKPLYALAIHDGLNDKLDSDGHVDFPTCTESVRQIVSEYCNAARPRKWLAYGATIASLTDIRETLKEIFGDVKLFTMHTGHSIDANERVLKQFVDCIDEAVLCNVDMLLEGTHLSTPIAGILNFRHIISPNVFWQMLGRLYDANSDTTPLFINIAGTKFYRPKVYSGLLGGLRRTSFFDSTIAEKSLHDVTSVQVIDYLKQLESLSFTTEVVVDGVTYKSWKSYYTAHETDAHVRYDAFLKRIQLGFTPYEALTRSTRKDMREIVVWRGREYHTWVELAKSTGLRKETISHLWNECLRTGEDFISRLEEAIKRVRLVYGFEPIEVNGVLCKDFYDVANALGISYGTAVRRYKESGKDMEKYRAKLTCPRKYPPIVFEGKEYRSVNQLCKSLGISNGTYNYYKEKYGERIEFDQALRKAADKRVDMKLITPVFDIEYDGNVFKSFSSFAKYVGVSRYIVARVFRETCHCDNTKFLEEFFDDLEVRRRLEDAN